MTKGDWEDIDFADFLGLTDILTPLEINDITSKLSEEIFTRVLETKLPKVVGKRKFGAFKKKFGKRISQEGLLLNAKRTFPEVDLEKLIIAVGIELKKEYLKSYISEFILDYEHIQYSGKEGLDSRRKLIGHLKSARGLLSRGRVKEATKEMGMANSYSVLLGKGRATSL